MKIKVKFLEVIKDDWGDRWRWRAEDGVTFRTNKPEFDDMKGLINMLEIGYRYRLNTINTENLKKEIMEGKELIIQV
jgi:hypothetical protein